MKTNTKTNKEAKSKYDVEYTDTFGGDANYSWVRRTQIEAPTLLAAIRKAKRFVGLDGVRCKRVWPIRDFGAALVPYGSCTILFVNPIY